jgi:hypothetical protein
MKRSFWLATAIAPLVAPIAYIAVVALTPDDTPKHERY